MFKVDEEYQVASILCCFLGLLFTCFIIGGEYSPRWSEAQELKGQAALLAKWPKGAGPKPDKLDLNLKDGVVKGEKALKDGSIVYLSYEDGECTYKLETKIEAL